MAATGAERASLAAAGPLYEALGPVADALADALHARDLLAAGEVQDARAALDRAEGGLRSAGPPRRAVVGLAAQAVRARIAAVEVLLGGWRFPTDGTWFEPVGGPRVELRSRPVLARLLAGLVAARDARPGDHLDVDGMCAAGWPGEAILAAAARNRVYVAVSTLRRLGLAPLQHEPGGYRLDPAVPIVVSGDRPA